MIEFNISKVDWEKYEYPGFEVGDILRDLVTTNLSKCVQVATAEELNLQEDDVPCYYKFIKITNPCIDGEIWVNPELFELAERPKTAKSKIFYSYQDPLEIVPPNNIARARIENPVERDPLDAIFERNAAMEEEEEAAEVAEAQANVQANALENNLNALGQMFAVPQVPNNIPDGFTYIGFIDTNRTWLGKIYLSRDNTQFVRLMDGHMYQIPIQIDIHDLNSPLERIRANALVFIEERREQQRAQFAVFERDVLDRNRIRR